MLTDEQLEAMEKELPSIYKQLAVYTVRLVAGDDAEEGAEFTEAEQDALLHEAGFDVEKGLAAAMEEISRERARRSGSKAIPFEWVQTRLTEILDSFTQKDLVEVVRSMAERAPRAAEELSKHPDWDSQTKEELDLLVDTLGELIESERS